MTQQYFLAIIPPEPHHSKLMELKQYCQENYQTSGALRSPPHITLHMPFKWPEEKQNQLEHSLQTMLGQQPSVEISVDGFGAFEPRVIFAKIDKSTQLNELYYAVKTAMKNIQIFNPSYKDRGFTPHLTIAFRDLKKPAFKLGWQYFEAKPFTANFTVPSIWLLKHDGNKWIPETEIQLKD